jgi:putative alpha-1,2-mannosidase
LNRDNPYYEQGNEPSHLIAFLFNRVGAPWLTQKWVHRLCTEAYSAAPNGLSGDDDEGQVSAWYVLGASGLAQACPGDPRYEIFSPLFDKVTLNLNPNYSKGKAFVITAQNNSPDNIYIQSATLNGKPLNRCWVSYAEITAGGTLNLVLGPQPNMKWGVESVAANGG